MDRSEREKKEIERKAFVRFRAIHSEGILRRGIEGHKNKEDIYTFVLDLSEGYAKNRVLQDDG